MNPLRNPYSPGAGSRPPALTGREAQIDSFEIKIERMLQGRSHKSFMITGLRGVGKTVLLRTLEGIAQQRGHKTASHEVTNETDFKGAISRHSRRLLISLDLVEKAKDKVMEAARVLKAFTLKTPGGIEFGFDITALTGRGDSGKFDEDLSDLFIALGEAALHRKTGIVFLLDEVQYLEKGDFEALIIAIHQVSQKSLPLTVVCAGLPQLPKLAGDAKSYSERLFDFPSIDRLEEDAATEALERPAKDLGVVYEKKATREILEFTNGYPYFLQEYGKHVWDIAKGPKITAKDVDRAGAQVINSLDESFFRVRIARTTPAELNYVSAMANLGKGPYKTGRIAGRLGKASTAVAPLRSQLIDKGLIYSPAHGKTEFTVPKFDDFLRRNHPHKSRSR